MDLYYRFFVREEGANENGEMIASKVRVDLSDDFKYKLDEIWFEEDEEDKDDFGEDPTPHSHGYNFDGMFKMETKIPLSTHVISGYFFDS